MLNKKLAILAVLAMIAPMVLTACGATPEPEVIEVEKIVTEVVEVVVTEIVEVAGTPEVVEKVVTEVVETEVQVVVTATPEPEPTEPPMASIAPEFKNPDTYMVVTGAGEPRRWTRPGPTRPPARPSRTTSTRAWSGSTRSAPTSLCPSWPPTGRSTRPATCGPSTSARASPSTRAARWSPTTSPTRCSALCLQDRIDGPHWMTLEAFFGLYTIEDLAIGDRRRRDPLTKCQTAALVETCETVKAAVVADDEAGTVTYNLFQPTPWFLAMLANSFLGAVTDKEWMVENGAWDGDCATWVQWHDPAAEDTILFNAGQRHRPLHAGPLDARRRDRAGGQRELLAGRR